MGVACPCVGCARTCAHGTAVLCSARKWLWRHILCFWFAHGRQDGCPLVSFSRGSLWVGCARICALGRRCGTSTAFGVCTSSNIHTRWLPPQEYCLRLALPSFSVGCAQRHVGMYVGTCDAFACAQAALLQHQECLCFWLLLVCRPCA